ncbi:MAG: M12 family metallo-peptidase, partial [Phycisphaerales bacterium]
IETDAEFTGSLFGGDLEAATEYATALLAASSEIFELDLAVRFRMSFLRLWEGEDPWDQTATGAQLGQFRDHWQALMSDVPRDLAHFFSGRGLGGGVAWLPGVCGSYGYALSANLGGSFPYPLEDHRHENWDLFVVSHEFGHNVGAPHTHSMSPPLDGCGNSDCSQAYGGTIMSYCHICPGGLSNIVLGFHPGSIASMLATLANVSCDYSCSPEPQAEPDSATGFAGEPLEINVLRNDRGGECSEVVLAEHDPTTAAGHAVDTFIGDDGRSWIVVIADGAAQGEDSFTYRILDAFGGTDEAEVVLDWVSPRRAAAVAGALDGIFGQHYEIPESSQLPDYSGLVPIASEILARIEIPSTGGEFAGSGRADLVASAFTGWLEVPATAIWTLYTDSDDGSKLWIGDTLVGDNDALHGIGEKSGAIALEAGLHPVRIEFFENFGGAGLIVRWSAAGVSKAVVPDVAWSHGGVVVSPDLDGDGFVGGSDLAAMLASWGDCEGCPADLDGDGTVGGGDLATLLAAWQVP